MQSIKCEKCGKVEEVINGWYYVGVFGGGECDSYFCSRICLVEGIAPEVTKAIVVRQWVPTPEEERRMSEEST